MRQVDDALKRWYIVMALAPLSLSYAPGTAAYAIARLNTEIEESTYRITSGQRFYDSGEDPGSIAAATKLQTQIRGLRQGILNGSAAGSLLQIAANGLSNISGLLEQMKALATAANSTVLTDNDRALLDVNFQALADAIDATVASTSFGGTLLLDGSASPFQFPLSENSTPTLDVTIDPVDTASLFGGTTPSIGTQVLAQAASDTVEDAQELVQIALAEVASSQSVVNASENNLALRIFNIDEARASLEDINLPKEISRHAALLIQQQAGFSVNAQTQALSSNLLDLLKFNFPVFDFLAVE